MKSDSNIVTIQYCSRCRWLLRAAWYAQELLSTFEHDLGGVTLKPSEAAGSFHIQMGLETIFDRREERGFIEAKELKKRVRDMIAPGRDLGHVDG